MRIFNIISGLGIIGIWVLFPIVVIDHFVNDRDSIDLDTWKCTKQVAIAETLPQKFECVQYNKNGEKE